MEQQEERGESHWSSHSTVSKLAIVPWITDSEYNSGKSNIGPIVLCMNNGGSGAKARKDITQGSGGSQGTSKNYQQTILSYQHAPPTTQLDTPAYFSWENASNNWRASCNKRISDFLGQIFFLVQMSSIFACDLGLNGKRLPHNFFLLFCFSFLRNFLEPALAANARFADSIVWKNKSFLWKGHRQEKFCIRYFWKMKEKPENLNRGYVFLWSGRPHAKIELIWTRKKNSA